MKILADECLDAPVLAALRDAGHDVLYGMEDMPGAADSILLERALKEGRLLITQDKDFGELVFRLRMATIGLILVRFSPDKQSEMAGGLLALLNEYPDRLAGSFVVLEERRIRFRALVPSQNP